MMTRAGHEVILYAGPENEAECAELVACTPVPAHSRPTVPDFTPESFAPMNAKVIEAMGERLGPRDLILLSSGYAQSAIIDAFTNHICVEYATGYFGTAAKYRVFPSHAWMHMVYGRWSQINPQAIRGQFYDAVIPHFLDPEHFPMGRGGEYLLFAARLNEDKGVGVAVDMAKRTGLDLKIIGAGRPPDFGEYLGVVGPKERAELMGGARAVLSPSLYCEPFCLVAIEAQMCGTPAITTDFGAFPETVAQGVSGYRCHTLAEFCQAALDAPTLNRDVVRTRALDLYSTDAIAPQYLKYFDRLGSLYEKGWYS